MSRREFFLALVALLTTGCAAVNPRPVYQTVTSASEGMPTLVVGVERDLDNADMVRTLAHELAFGLAQHGRAAIDLPTFVDEAALRGAEMPAAMQARLVGGVADAETLAWLDAQHVASIVFLEIGIFEQAWGGGTGKRTRVGLTARGQRRKPLPRLPPSSPCTALPALGTRGGS